MRWGMHSELSMAVSKVGLKAAQLADSRVSLSVARLVGRKVEHWVASTVALTAYSMGLQLVVSRVMHWAKQMVCLMAEKKECC